MLVTWMKSNLSTKALLESKLGSRVEESLPKKKKERKEEGTREIRRAAKAAKSRGGRPKRCSRGCLCPGLRAAAAVGAGRAAVTLAAEGVTDAAGTGHGPVSGAGAGHPAAVVQRHPLTCQWQSQGTVGAKSRRRSFMEEQGLLWPRPHFPLLQRPLFSTTARSPSGGLQLMAALGPADLEPAWQWQFRQMGASKGRRAGTNGPRRTKAEPDPKDKPPEGGEVFAAAPTAPGEDPYQVAVATKEEIEAAAASARKRASTPIYGRRPHSRPWLIPIGLCVLGSWSRMAA